MRSAKDDVDAIGRMPMASQILDGMAEVTGMRFTAIARITENAWIACAVHDGLDGRLHAGDELELCKTISDDIREHRQPVFFGCNNADGWYQDHHSAKRNGFESYISFPIVRADGSFFGTLCAFDPRPIKLDVPTAFRTLERFAQLIAEHLDLHDCHDK